MLLQAEAVRRIRGQASIHEAARNGHEELVALHIAANDQCVNAMAKRGTSELSVYASCRPSDAAPSPNLSHPQFAFCHSTFMNSYSVFPSLCPIFSVTPACSTSSPLYEAVEYGQENVVRLLLQAQAQVNQINGCQTSTASPLPPLTNARQELALCCPSMTPPSHALFSFGPAFGDAGSTSLHKAVQKGRHCIASLLLNSKADPNAFNR